MSSNQGLADQEIYFNCPRCVTHAQTCACVSTFVHPVHQIQMYRWTSPTRRVALAVSQCPKPGRLSSRFDCLSARFSFNVLLGFLTFCFFGDLSPMISLSRAGREVRAGFA